MTDSAPLPPREALAPPGGGSALAWGIDGGDTGAACLTTWSRPMSGTSKRYERKGDPRHGQIEPSIGECEWDAIAAYYWRPSVDGYRVTDMHGKSWTEPSMLAVATVLCLLHPDPAFVSIEGVFIGKNPRDALTLAESIGELRRPFMALAIGDVLRPQATEWRARMVRRASATAAEFKRLSLHWSPRHIAGGLGALAKVEHATDAGHISCFDPLLRGVIAAKADAAGAVHASR